MRQAVLLTLTLVMIASTAVSDEPISPLKITLESYKSPRAERYIVGEPIPFRVTIKNSIDNPLKLTGLPLEGRSTKIHIEGNIREDCKLEELRILGYLTPSTLEPHQEVVKSWEAGGLGILDVGEYEIWIEYDASAESAKYLDREVIPRIRVESNRLRFEIVEPVGIDAQAFEKLASACNEMLDYGNNRERILDEFPSSTYAGWALLGQPHPIENPRAALGVFLPRKLPKEPALRESEQRIRSARHSLFADNAEKLMTFLQARPDFDGANRMRFQIAWYQCHIGEFAKAKETLAIVLEEDNIQTWLRDQATVLYAFAKERSEKKEQR